MKAKTIKSEGLAHVPSVWSKHNGENIEERNGKIKCTVCGYRVLKKTNRQQ